MERDLAQLAAKAKISKPAHRDELIDQVLASLDRKRSVLLLGAEGVGKSAILHGLAHRLSHLDANKKKKRGLLELSTGSALAGTKYLGEWESKADKTVKQAIRSGSILYYLDIWNLPYTGKSSNNPSNLFDFYQTHMNDKGLLLIGEITHELLQEAQKISGFLQG